MNTSVALRAMPVTRIKILIVDDLAEVRQDLRTILQLAQDLEIVGEAANGIEAVQLLDKLSPDVVLMDLAMPGLDGLEATRQIKGRHPSKRVVVLTIHDDDLSRERAAEAGADAFVEKGSGVAALLGTIRRVGGRLSQGQDGQDLA